MVKQKNVNIIMVRQFFGSGTFICGNSQSFGWQCNSCVDYI